MTDIVEEARGFGYRWRDASRRDDIFEAMVPSDLQMIIQRLFDCTDEIERLREKYE